MTPGVTQYTHTIKASRLDSYLRSSHLLDDDDRHPDEYDILMAGGGYQMLCVDEMQAQIAIAQAARRRAADAIAWAARLARREEEDRRSGRVTDKIISQMIPGRVWRRRDDSTEAERAAWAAGCLITNDDIRTYWQAHEQQAAREAAARHEAEAADRAKAEEEARTEAKVELLTKIKEIKAQARDEILSWKFNKHARVRQMPDTPERASALVGLESGNAIAREARKINDKYDKLIRRLELEITSLDPDEAKKIKDKQAQQEARKAALAEHTARQERLVNLRNTPPDTLLDSDREWLIENELAIKTNMPADSILPRSPALRRYVVDKCWQARTVHGELLPMRWFSAVRETLVEYPVPELLDLDNDQAEAIGWIRDETVILWEWQDGSMTTACGMVEVGRWSPDLLNHQRCKKFLAAGGKFAPMETDPEVLDSLPPVPPPGRGTLAVMGTTVLYDGDEGIALLQAEQAEIKRLVGTFERHPAAGQALELLNEAPTCWTSRLVWRLSPFFDTDDSQALADFVEVSRRGFAQIRSIDSDLRCDSTDKNVRDIAKNYQEECSLLTYEVLHDPHVTTRARIASMVYLGKLRDYERSYPYYVRMAEQAGQRVQRREILRRMKPLLDRAQVLVDDKLLDDKLDLDPLPLIIRSTDLKWWTGKIRKAHMQSVEYVARGLALHGGKGGWKAVTPSTVRRIQAQDCFQKSVLENQYLRNPKTGEFASKWDLLQASSGSASARQGEMYERTIGIARFAIKTLGLMPVFSVITLQSKYHRTTAGNAPNPRWDGASVKAGAQHLTELFNDFLRLLNHQKIKHLYYWTAESHGDGTPHWNLISFIQPQDFKAFCRLLRTKFLHETRRGRDEGNANEAGANLHRVKISRIRPYEDGDKKKVIERPVKPNDNDYEGMLVYKQDLELYTARLIDAVQSYAFKYVTKNLGRQNGPDTVKIDAELAEGTDTSDVPVYSKDGYSARCHGINTFAVGGITLPINVWRTLQAIPKKNFKDPEFYQHWPEPLLQAWSAATGAVLERGQNGQLAPKFGVSGLEVQDRITGTAAVETDGEMVRQHGDYARFLELTEWTWRDDYEHGDLVSLQVFDQYLLSKIEDEAVIAAGVEMQALDEHGEMRSWRELTPRVGTILDEMPAQHRTVELDTSGQARRGKPVLILANLNACPWKKLVGIAHDEGLDPLSEKVRRLQEGAKIFLAPGDWEDCDKEGNNLSNDELRLREPVYTFSDLTRSVLDRSNGNKDSDWNSDNYFSASESRGLISNSTKWGAPGASTPPPPAPGGRRPMPAGQNPRPPD